PRYSRARPDRELCNQESRAIAQANRHPVSGLDPKRDQGSGESIALGVKPLVANGRALEQERRAIGPPPRRFAQVVDQRAIWIRMQRTRYALVVVREPSGFRHCVPLW